MAKPELIKKQGIEYQKPQYYERYLPTAFDESMSILEKVNKVIYQLNEIGRLTNEMLERWNDVIDWVMNEGLEQAVIDQLNKWLEDGTLKDIINKEIFGELNDKIEKIIAMLDTRPITIEVGTSAKYATLQKAIDYVDELPVKPTKVTITFGERFVLSEQIMFINKDFRFVEIYSDKPILVEGFITNRPYLFYGENASLPSFNAKFEYTGSGAGDYREITAMYLNNSNVFIHDGNGFTGFPNTGIYAVNGSNVVANQCDFSNNGNINAKFGDGFYIESSQLTAIETKANNCGNDGFNFYSGSYGNIRNGQANRCGHHGLNATQACTVNANGGEFKDVLDNAVVAFANTEIDLRGAICTNSGNSAVVAQNGSHISFDNGDVSGSGFDGLQSKHGASISFDNGKANNCKQGGAHLTQGHLYAYDAEFKNNGREGIRGNGGMAQLHGCTITGNKGNNINARVGASINAYNCNLSDAGESGVRFSNSEMIINDSKIDNSANYAIHSTAGGKANASGCSINNTGNTGVYASGGEINCTGSTITNSGNYAVQALRGAQIIAYAVKTSGSASYDFAVSSSAIIQASEATGSANRPVNEMTHNGFILSNTLKYNG